VDDLVARLRQPPTSKIGEIGDIDPSAQPTLRFESNFTREQFEQAVRTGQEYIRAGDIFQFVPSQRLRVACPADPLDVYRALRIINPSPFMFFLKSPACTLIGSSPEILCRVDEGKVTSRPLAGTRRRGATPVEDKLLEAELLADPKERAEHIMLVDLHRNDVGRVSKIGSVHVDDVMTVERYSHVMHITTNVTGQLDEGMTALDALRVSLPVGTVSRRGAALTAGRWGTWISRGTWTPASPCARSCGRAACSTCRPGRAWWPTRCRRPNTKKP
jgi:anthranilate synthase component 1